jgi:dTDP-4-dehydrorhamnose reductase
MPIRVLVTGRQGQVARALAELGPACDVEVIPMGRPRLDLIA